MSDPRLTPFSGRMALRGTQVHGATETDGTPARVTAPLVDLCRKPNGRRDRQMLRGALVRVIDRQPDHAFVQSQADGYCGWVTAPSLGPDRPVTHRVHALATHLYTAPDLKSPDVARLSLNSQLSLDAQSGDFAQSDCGNWVPVAHVTPLTSAAPDPVSVARQFLGVPYLWGGNSCWGIDCSGLVQAALLACHLPCPGDSDLQMAALGPKLPKDTDPKRGDLLFWAGHVAWVSGPDTMLHSTAYGMAVREEPLGPACARIAEKTPLLAHIRPGTICES